MKIFQNVSHLVPEFKSFSEMNTKEHGAVVRDSRVIMQDTHTSTYFLVDIFFYPFVGVQETWFKRHMYTLHTVGKLFLPLEEDGWVCDKILFFFSVELSETGLTI